MSNNNEEIVISTELSEEDLQQIAGGIKFINLRFPTKDGKPDFHQIKGSVGKWTIDIRKS